MLDLKSRINEKIRDYITSERERIDNILTEQQPEEAK